MQLFLTGWQGYVGSAVLRAAEAGDRFTVLVRSEAEADVARAAGHKPAIGDLADRAWLADEAGRADAVVHCAASDDPRFQPLNEAAVDGLLSGLRPTASLVLHGGSLVFGPGGADGAPARPTRTAPPPFLSARAAIDQRLIDEGQQGRRVAGVYGSFVYGRGRGAAIPAAWASAARAHGHVAVPGGGEARWGCSHVDDWGRLILLAARTIHPRAGPLFAAGSSRTVSELASALGAALGLPVQKVPPERVAEAGAFGQALSINQWFDPATAIALGWTESGPGPEDAVAEGLAAPIGG